MFVGGIWGGRGFAARLSSQLISLRGDDDDEIGLRLLSVSVW